MICTLSPMPLMFVSVFKGWGSMAVWEREGAVLPLPPPPPPLGAEGTLKDTGASAPLLKENLA